MISTGRALVCAVAMSASGARAGVWISNPMVGFTTDYSSNPGLLSVEHDAETHAAFLIDLPTSYVGNALRITLQPTFRVGDSSGYSNLTSNYAHLTGSVEVDGERDSLVFTGQASQDSSLYYDYGYNGATGVRRDTTLEGVSWTHSLTERLSFNADLNSSRVLYGTSNDLAVLTDYRYSSAAPTLSFSFDERTKFSLMGGASLYTSLDDTTRSVDTSLSAGLTRLITEIWSFSANAGYSRESNKLFFGSRRFESNENGSVFSAHIARQGQLLTLTAAATRALTPVGLAFLSKQNSYELDASYAATERLTFAGQAQWVSVQTPQIFGGTIDQRFLSFRLSATWLATEHWTGTLQSSRVAYTYGSPPTDVSANGITLQIAYRFNEIKWQQR